MAHLSDKDELLLLAHLSDDRRDDGWDEGAGVDGEVEDGEEGLELSGLLR